MGRPQRRRLPHLHRAGRLADLQQALLELDGRVVDPSALAEAPLFKQGAAALAERVEEFATPHSAFSSPETDGPRQGPEALRQLLGAHSDYDGEASTVVPMDIPLLAAPSCAGSSQPALAGREGPYSVQGFCEQYILPSADAEMARESSDFVRPYCDPLLRSQRGYAALLARLVKAGMISFSSSPGHTEAVFLLCGRRMGANDWWLMLARLISSSSHHRPPLFLLAPRSRG